MGWYFNRGRGNLPLTLTSGRSVSVPGNSWVELTGRDETTSSVLRARQKKLLHRQDAPPPGYRKPVEKPTRPLVKTVAAVVDQPPAEKQPPKPAKIRKRRRTSEERPPIPDVPPEAFPELPVIAEL